MDALCAAFEPHRGVDPRTGLSGQQRKIAVLLAQGVTDKQIGEALFLSENTVKSHLRRAYLALGISSRAELVSHVYEMGLMPIQDEQMAKIPREVFAIFLSLVVNVQIGNEADALVLARKASALLALRTGAAPTDRPPERPAGAQPVYRA